MSYTDQQYVAKTKLELLRNYQPEQKKGAWVAMGSQEINLLTPKSYFTPGNLYWINIANISLTGYLIYCDKEFIGNINWSDASCVDTVNGLISFGNSIVSPCFYIIMTQQQFDQTTALQGFIPFQDEFQETSLVQISDAEYRLCTSCLGTPFILDEELEYSREDIINLAIRPSLEEYFKWFPKHYVTTHTISSTDSIDVEFPTGAYGVLHWDVQQAGTSIATGGIANTLLRSFEDAYFGNCSAANITGSYYGNRAPHTSLGGVNNLLLSRAATQGMVNYSTRSFFDVYTAADGKKHAKFYSTKGGVAEIFWGMETWNFNDVEFARLPELRKLCNANVKLLFGNLRRQAKSGIPGAYDYSGWVTEAQAEIKEVREDWMKIPKASGILRGSLS